MCSRLPGYSDRPDCTPGIPGYSNKTLILYSRNTRIFKGIQEGPVLQNVYRTYTNKASSTPPHIAHSLKSINIRIASCQFQGRQFLDSRIIFLIKGKSAWIPTWTEGRRVQQALHSSNFNFIFQIHSFVNC